MPMTTSANYSFRYLAGLAMLGILVGGCGSIETAHVLSTLSGKVVLAEIENGTIGKASSFDQQCKILMEWPGALNEMSMIYPNTMSHRVTDIPFVQYFGKPYDDYSEEVKATIRAQLIDPCIQKNRRWNSTDILQGMILKNYITFVRAAFPNPQETPTQLTPYFGPQLVVAAKRDRREREEARALWKEKDEFQKRCPAHRRPVDFSRNPLADRKYEQSALLYEGPNLKVYAVKVLSKTQVNLVAIHEGLGEQDPIMDLNPSDASYSQKMLEQFNCAILPNVLYEWPDANTVHIAHYAKDVHLPNITVGGPVEQPMGESLFKQGGGAQWVPGVVSDRMQANRNTLAQWKQIIAYQEAKTDASYKELAAKRAKRDDAERQKQEQTVKAGLVYKNRSYWSQFQAGEELNTLFSGEQVPSVIHRSFYVSYVNTYSEVCDKHLPSDSVTLESYRIRRSIIGDQKEDVRTVRVHPQFVANYKIYQDDPGFITKWETIQKILRDGIKSFTSEAMSDYFEPYLGMQKFVKGAGCQSATMRQMSENVLRHALGQPSLHAAGARIPQAAQESDAVTKPSRFTRFEDGCLDYEAGEMKKWCSCLDRVYRGVMTQEERVRYANDHQAWLDEVRNTQPQGKHDPRWRLYEPLNQCLN
ncbi:MAG: hypothetical protein E8D42_06820 [Nitrospira sp.]|nr:MAG: hypothetical protein E8D42_06820 [Nitrospira sp.]